jgi:hypothetical protein
MERQSSPPKTASFPTNSPAGDSKVSAQLDEEVLSFHKKSLLSEGKSTITNLRGRQEIK